MRTARGRKRKGEATWAKDDCRQCNLDNPFLRRSRSHEIVMSVSICDKFSYFGGRTKKATASSPRDFAWKSNRIIMDVVYIRPSGRSFISDEKYAEKFDVSFLPLSLSLSFFSLEIKNSLRKPISLATVDDHKTLFRHSRGNRKHVLFARRIVFYPEA